MFNTWSPTVSHQPELPAEGFIRLNRLIPGIIPYSRATIWRKVQTGDFPRPVKLSERITAWRTSDIRKWIEEQGAMNEKGGT
jgi:prophage regulatory protein